MFPGGFDPGHQVTFHKITIGVRAYELRTGKRVVNTKVTIGGASCPRVLHYEYYGTFDTGPPGDVLVRPSAAEIRDAFTRVFIRK